MEQEQLENLKKLKKERNNLKVKESLQNLSRAAQDSSNLMPRFIECAKAYATIGEMIDVLKEEFGEYQEPIVF